LTTTGGRNNMAYYGERHPNDKSTEEFMTNIGFTLHPSCFGYEWHGHGQFFVLKEDIIIRSLQQLINHIKDETYVIAFRSGKADAIAKLYEKMNSAVFEPPEVNHDKRTVE